MRSANRYNKEYSFNWTILRYTKKTSAPKHRLTVMLYFRRQSTLDVRYSIQMPSSTSGVTPPTEGHN